MKKSFKPYVFFEDEKDAVYIVRIAPFKTGVELQLVSDDTDFEICIYAAEKFVKSIKTREKKVTIDGLKQGVEYSVLVKSASGESRKRLFVTGDYLGTVVNYLHPEDEYYAFSGRYVASPFILRFKGDLYVSMDVFHGKETTGAYNLTLLYRSKDDGRTWEYVTDILPSFWGSLFVAKDKLCILAASGEAGSLVVMSSEDGENWSEPTYLVQGYGCGPTIGCGIHKSAVPCVEKDGRLYFALEYGGYEAKRFDTLVGSVDLSKDVCDKTAWRFSETARVEFDWCKESDRTIRFAIEGNVVEREGELLVISRHAYQKAVMWKYDEKEPLKAPAFLKILDFPPAQCKFYIQKAEDGSYYAMGNTTCYPRHVLKLYHSKDLENWETVKTLEDISAKSAEQDGVQYPTFIMENGELYTVLRNSLNGGHNFHDSNAIVFKKYDLQ